MSTSQSATLDLLRQNPDSMPRVAMDFDNTFFDSLRFFMELFRQATGKRYTLQMFTDPRWWRTFGFVTEQQEADFNKLYVNALTDLISSDSFMPLKFEPHLLDKLAEVAHVDFVTAVPRPIELLLGTLISRKFPTSRPGVIIVDSIESKVMLPYDFFIDDSPKVAALVQAHNRLRSSKAYYKRHLMPAMPYNASVEESYGVTRLDLAGDAVRLARKEALAWTAERRPVLDAPTPKAVGESPTKSYLKG